MKGNRAVIPVWALWVLGGMAATQLVPNWRLPALFAKAPPTKELIQAQADLAKAQKEANDAKGEVEKAKQAKLKKNV